MTCIIAYIDKDGVGHMAGDSAGTALGYHSRSDNVHPKVFRNGEMLIGYTTSFRMGQLLQYAFTPPEHPEGMDSYAYMIKLVVPEIRKTFVSSHYIKADDKEGGTFMIVYRGKLFFIQEDYAVFERPHNFDSCGSGQTSSNTVFETIIEFGMLDHIGVREAMMKALEITSRHNITVSGRMDYLNTQGESFSREAIHR